MYAIGKWVALLLIGALSVIGLNNFLHYKKMEKMTFFYEQGFYEKSREELAKINEKRMKYPYAMYQAYLAIGEKEFLQARCYLDKAITFSSGKNLLLEMELNLCNLLCNLANHDLEGMKRSLESFSPSAYDHLLFRFAQGIVAYENGAYIESVKAWEKIHYFLLQQELTPWGTIALEQLYSQDNFELNLASSLIEVENYFAAREILEQLLREKNAFNSQQSALFLLGYSYLKESQILCNEHSLKLAAFYFDKVHFEQLSEQRQKQILAYLEEVALRALDERVLSSEKLTYLLFPLEHWKQEKTIHKIEALLAARLEKTEDVEFFKNFQKISPPIFFEKLQEHLFAKLQLSLEKASPSFTPLWNMLAYNQAATTKIHELLFAEMIHKLEPLICSDTEDLQLFQSQIKMLEQRQISKEQLNLFSNPLFALSTKLWMMSQEEKKATLLMQLAYRLSSNKTIMKTKIEKFLLPLFDRAQEANLVERLSKIFDALTVFHITPKCIDHPTTIANHLEDANYRFYSQHFVEAKALCGWILKLEPNNQAALKILGLSCYFLGEFEEACFVLNQLQLQDELTEKARILSEVLGGKSKAELVQSQRFQQEGVN